jgi:hypothetical protein
MTLGFLTAIYSRSSRNSVRFRGWGYPYVNHRTGPERGSDWAGQEYDGDDSIESWRFHTNGLFAHLFAMRDPSQNWRVDSNGPTDRYLDFLDGIYSFLEIFEFAARLAQSQAGGNSMKVEIAIKNIQGRRLFPDFRIIRDRDNYSADCPEWADRWEISQTELIARPRELAAEAARDFFARFGMSVSLDVLKRHQEKIAR